MRTRVVLALLLVLSSRGARAQTPTTTTTLPTGITFHQPGFSAGGQWTGTSVGIPTRLGGLVFHPSGSPLYVIGGLGTATPRLYAVTVDRDAITDEITDLVGPAVQIFTGTLVSLDSGLAFGPAGTFFYSYYPANRIAERPGGVAGAETVFTPPATFTTGIAALTFNPHAARVDPTTGFGRLLLGDGNATLREVLLTPTAGNLFQPGASAPRYVQSDAPIGGMGQALFLPTPLQGDLMYAAYGDGQLRVIEIDPATGLPIDEGTGLPQLGTSNPIDTVFASGFGSEEFAGPFGLAIDPLTNDLFVTTNDGLPSNTIIKIEGFSTAGSTTTTLQTTSTSTSTSTSTTSMTSTSLPGQTTSTSTSSTTTTSTSTTSTTSTSLPGQTTSTSTSSTTTTSTSTTSTTSTSLPGQTTSTSTSSTTTTSTSTTSTTSTSLPGQTTSTSTSTTSTSSSSTTSTSRPGRTTSTSTSTTSTSSTGITSSSTSTSSTTSTTFPGQTTTTSSSSSTTTSTLPRNELCSNCLDDNGNGLADYDDPACCGGAEPHHMELEGIRIRPGETDSKLKLRARFDGIGLEDLAFAFPALALQVSDDVEDAPLFCARIPSDSLHVSRKVLKFRDRRGDVAEAKGLRTVRIEQKRAGTLLLAVTGKRAAFLARGSTELRITLAVLDPSQGPPECVSAVEPVRPTTRGGIRFP